MSVTGGTRTGSEKRGGPTIYEVNDFGGKHSPRDLPRLVASGVRIVWRAARRELLALLVLEALTAVGIGGTDLSLGQWQRLAIARAFFRDAPLVVLDEPTAALDAKAEHELFDRIRELFADRSVLLISHRFSTVRSADRIYVLSDGSVVESGTHGELLAADGIYAELFTLQASPYR
jgi:ATP-binding cassette subfamily B protein